MIVLPNSQFYYENNRFNADSNLFVDSSVNSLSNCCFAGSQIAKCRDKNGEYECSFEELAKMDIDADSLEVPIYQDWKKCKLIVLPRRPMYRVVIGDREVVCTDNHLFPVGSGTDVYCVDKSAKDINVGDKIPVYDFDTHFSVGVDVTSVERFDDGSSEVYCFEMEDQSSPYFMLANGVITHNCRLKSNIEELGYFNSIGGSALKVGSVKVNTVNLARVALDSKTEDEYLENLKYRTYVCLCALDAVRHIIKRNVEKGILPNFTYGLVDFGCLYNTTGFLGVYETMKKFGYTKKDEFGNTYYTEEASAFGEKIFKTMRSVADDFLKEYKCDYQVNCEQIPGESAAAKLMQKDKFFYPRANIYDLPLYGNQFIPLGIQTTLQERVRIQAMFDSYCNGGSILHANLDAPFDSFDKAWKMVNYIADKGVTYFAFNTKIQACEDNHAFYGSVCPVCGKPVASEYTRIVGFYTRINDWSHERKDEYKLRKWEDMNHTVENI